MAKARSPAYPAIGLKEAVEHVAAIYKENYQNPIPRTVAAAHMGYKGLNGKSLGILSALLKFGLLEGRGDDTRVSDLGMTIIAHPPGTPERAGALKTAAEKPELFAELDQRFQGGKASDQAIRSYLLTQKFIPVAVDAVIRSYRDTKQLVDTETGGYNILPGPTDAEQRDQQTIKQAVALNPGQTNMIGAITPMPIFQVSVTTGAIEVNARLLSPADIDRLIQVLNANKVILETNASVSKESAP